MKLKFEYWKAENKQWYFHVKSNNGEILFQSEGYKRKAGCLNVYRILTSNPQIEKKQL